MAERDMLLMGVADGLNSVADELQWSVDDDRVVGPDGLSAELHDRHPVESAQIVHVDVDVVIDTEFGQHRLTDCVAGVGADRTAALTQAVRTWTRTTAYPVTALLENRMELVTPERHATSLPGIDLLVGPPAHIATGPVPHEDAWWESFAFGEFLGATLGEQVRDSRSLHGVKLLWYRRGAGRGAEVRVDGTVHDEATRALLDLDWPMSEQYRRGRRYVIFVPDLTP